MKNRIFFLVLVVIFSCKKNNVIKNCEQYFKNFQNYIVVDNNKALIELENAINCNSSNIEYRFEKVKLLIKIKKYDIALFEINKLENEHKESLKYFPLSGFLNIKLGNIKKGHHNLELIYNSLEGKSFDSENFNLFYNKILIDLYFKNKDYTLEQINKYIDKNKLNDSIQFTLNSLIQEIHSDKKPLEIIYLIYGIPID